MKLDEANLALIAKVQTNGDIASVHALYDNYREKFEQMAMYHFNKHPFDYEMAKLPNYDATKQRFVFDEAYVAFDRACRTYKPSVCAFETWLSREIEWLFGEKSEMAGEKSRFESETWRQNNEHNVYLGRYVKYGKAIVWHYFDTDNYEPDLLKSSYVDMMDAVLKAVPKECPARKTVMTTLQTYVEGFENQGEAARRLDITQQAVSKGCKSVLKWLPEKLREKIREEMRG